MATSLTVGKDTGRPLSSFTLVIDTKNNPQTRLYATFGVMGGDGRVSNDCLPGSGRWARAQGFANRGALTRDDDIDTMSAWNS